MIKAFQISTKEVSRQLDDTTEELLQIISSTSQDKINRVPFEGSWTAGQVAEHLTKSGSAIIKALQGPARETSRNPAENVKEVKAIFLDFNIRFEAADFLQPPNINYKKEMLIESLKAIHAQLNNVIETFDLTQTCLNAVPALTDYTRLELIYFVIYHTQRHIRQLRNIHDQVSVNI